MKLYEKVIRQVLLLFYNKNQIFLKTQLTTKGDSYEKEHG
jgi:hypothetical protein